MKIKQKGRTDTVLSLEVQRRTTGEEKAESGFERSSSKAEEDQVSLGGCRAAVEFK